MYIIVVDEKSETIKPPSDKQVSTVVIMNYVKLSKSEKIKLREARDEFQIIIRRAREIGFDYIVFRPPQTKISFGGCTDRQVLGEYNKIPQTLGPGEYNLTYMLNADHPAIKKTIAKNGYGGLAYRAVRFDESELDLTEFYIKGPNIPIKNVINQTNVKNKYSAVKTRISESNVEVPGPGTYFNRFKRKSIFQHKFGGKITTVPAVHMICNSRNLSNCSICSEQPIVGDFWINWRTKKEICRKCMEYKRKNIKIKEKFWRTKIMKLRELDNFQMVRYCEFYHNHQGTAAAIRLLTNFELKQKCRRENYLSIFNF